MSDEPHTTFGHGEDGDGHGVEPVHVADLPRPPRELVAKPGYFSTVPTRMLAGLFLLVVSLGFLFVGHLAFDIRVLDDLALELFATTTPGEILAVESLDVVSPRGDAHLEVRFRFQVPDEAEPRTGVTVVRSPRGRARVHAEESLTVEYLSFNPRFNRMAGETVSPLPPLVAYIALGLALLGAFMLLRAPAAHRRVLRVLTHGKAVQGTVSDVRRRGASTLVRYRFPNPNKEIKGLPEEIPASRQTYRAERTAGLTPDGPIAVLVDPDNPMRDVPPQLVGVEFHGQKKRGMDTRSAG